MILLNFSHPLTLAQLDQVRALLANQDEPFRLVELPLQFPPNARQEGWTGFGLLRPGYVGCDGGAETDIVEERGGARDAYECTWSRPSGRAPASFLDAFPGASCEVVKRDNFWDYVGA